MNPFAAHDANQKAYEEMLAEPVQANEPEPGPWVKYAGAKWVATVGHFQTQQVLEPGGFVPMLLCQVILRKENVPAGVLFKSGDLMTVKQVGGTERECKVYSVDYVYTEFRIMVKDANE